MRQVVELPGKVWLVASVDDVPRIKTGDDTNYLLFTVGAGARLMGTSTAWADYLDSWIRDHKQPAKPSNVEAGNWSCIRAALAECRLVQLQATMKDGAA